jgi:predicted O-methyltransferase YrrM
MLRSFQRALRNRFKNALHRLFLLGQPLGFDLLPRHFYSDIPDIRELKRSNHWRRPLSMYGINAAAIDEQLDFVRRCVPPEIRQQILDGDIYSRACEENGAIGFGPIEAEFLYAFIRAHRPRKVVQVGAGVSTSVMLRAAADAGHDAMQLLCVDPFPTGYLKRLAQAGTIQLLAEPAQTVDLNVLTDIGEGDLLFIDSTHTSKVGSEVNRVIFEVLPRLRPGAMVHFHDILFPYDYSRVVLTSLFFGRESSLLYAFLLNNSKYRIAACLSMLHYERPQQLKEMLPHYQPAPNADGLDVPGTKGDFPSSIYLSVTKPQ